MAPSPPPPRPGHAAALRIIQTECQDPTRIKNVITKNRSKHRRLLWEQEQKIMFCDVSKLDDAQRTYVLVMRSQIAKEKASLLSSSRGSSAGDGDGESCA
jgi:hypothetical protein